jgi:hypothetical protein
MPDHAVERQKLTLVEEAALKNYINDCYQSGLPLSPGLLRDFANQLCRAKGDDKPVKINWHLGTR